MKFLILVVTLVLHSAAIQGQNNVRLVDHTGYMRNVFQEVITELENKEWCNMKVIDITTSINETVLDRHYEGDIRYFNGFLVSMQLVDIRQQPGINQIWSWNATEGIGTVLVQGALRLHDVAIGYDVEADLEDGRHRYTMMITYPLVTFEFSIRRNTLTEEMTVEVVGTVITLAPISSIKFLPNDYTTDVLTTVFDIRALGTGITEWGENVFAPVTLDVIKRVEFPVICYDCPITV